MAFYITVLATSKVKTISIADGQTLTKINVTREQEKIKSRKESQLARTGCGETWPSREARRYSMYEQLDLLPTYRASSQSPPDHEL